MRFEESIFGGQHDVQVPCLETCDDCGGTGAKSRDSIKVCKECGGRGGVSKTQKTPFGLMSQVLKLQGLVLAIHPFWSNCRSPFVMMYSLRSYKVIIPMLILHPV